MTNGIMSFQEVVQKVFESNGDEHTVCSPHQHRNDIDETITQIHKDKYKKSYTVHHNDIDETIVLAWQLPG